MVSVRTRGCLGRARRWDSGLFGRARRASEDDTSGVYCQAAKTDQAAREQVTYSQRLYLTSFLHTTANNLQELPSWELNIRARAKKDSRSLVFPILWKSSRCNFIYCYDKIFVYLFYSRCHYISFVHDL